MSHREKDAQKVSNKGDDKQSRTKREGRQEHKAQPWDARLQSVIDGCNATPQPWGRALCREMS